MSVSGEEEAEEAVVVAVVEQEEVRRVRPVEAEQVPRDLKVNSIICTATDHTMEVAVQRPRPVPSPAGAVGYSSINRPSSNSSKHNLTLAATPPARYHWKMVSTLDTQTRHTRTPTAHRSAKNPTQSTSTFEGRPPKVVVLFSALRDWPSQDRPLPQTQTHTLLQHDSVLLNEGDKCFKLVPWQQDVHDDDDSSSAI